MKYYIWSGDLKDIVQANDPDEAFIIAINKVADEEIALADSILISEVGYEGNGDCDVIMKTQQLIERLDITHLFKEDEDE